jgi:hypothetical protein
MEQAIKLATGRAATDVSYVSPGGEKWLVYVGVAGKSVKPLRYNPVPRGDPKMPEEAVRIYRETHEAFMNAIRRGATGEDDSRGFALSKEDEELRTKQLAMHEYAKRNEGPITAVLRGSGNAEQRAMAAELLGYTDRSPRQIAELVRAARDADDGVRNNATRALIVLARSDAKTAAMIPAADFVDMLNSGEWTDRNKAGGLLAELTRTRDRRVLAALKSRALVSLIDMARWATDHAESARWMLGRIAGIQEERLEQMVGEDSKVEMVIRAARRRK